MSKLTAAMGVTEYTPLPKALGNFKSDTYVWNGHMRTTLKIMIVQWQVEVSCNLWPAFCPLQRTWTDILHKPCYTLQNSWLTCAQDDQSLECSTLWYWVISKLCQYPADTARKHKKL